MFKIAAKVTLRPGREFPVQQGHPWIFSGAVESVHGSAEAGDIVEVCSSKGETLGLGFFHPQTSIAIRVFSFGTAEEDPELILQSILKRAIEARKGWLQPSVTCRRLVNAEGDSLPGLVVDEYAGHLVIQVGILGIERRKDFFVQLLTYLLKPESIFERSDSSSRREEGLEACVENIFGETPAEVLVYEGDMRLAVDIVSGQKTGFFIDQREMRRFVREHSDGKRVLNCFSYTGGFSVAALLGGAQRVVSVDSSEGAIALCNRNVELNSPDPDLHESKCVNAFDYLGGTHERFDLVILDPPAFAKQRDHLKNALKAYRQINSTGMNLVLPGGLLVTSSCSNFVTEEEFEQVVLEACGSSGRQVSIIGKHRQAIDHPVLAAHEQGKYLKSLILRIL